MERSENTEMLIDHLQSFIPPNSFDAHAHIYRVEDATESLPQDLADEQGHIGWQVWNQSLNQWMRDIAPTGGLFFTIPKPELDRKGANRFVADEVARHVGSRSLMIIHPADDPSRVEAEVLKKGHSGFKVYHLFAHRTDTFQASCEDFLPEWAWEIAHRHELAIMLHLVGNRALSDQGNQAYIQSHCRKYRNARLVLAHGARGFCARHTVEGLEAIRGLENVFFDTSAICESPALEAILQTFGPTRLLFGTDFPVCEIYGRAISVGDGFLWLGKENVDWEHSPFAQPELVGIESLLALQQACRTLRLIDSDIEKIFCTSARNMLGIGNQEGTDKTQETYLQARHLIPGGTQLLSKRPEMYAPNCWPAYFSEAHGCEVIDLDGQSYCDMTTSGIGSCLLGYADPDVSDAVIRRVGLGSMSSLNAPEEVELAELLTSLHPWAQQVRFCRTGGESMAVAVRIARTCTRRDQIAFCGYHGWSDWYLAANLPEQDEETLLGNDPLRGHLLPGLAPNGVPRSLEGTAHPFHYNQIEELQQIVDNHRNQLAAVVMEPFRNIDPIPGFLEKVRDICKQCGALLIFDEISSGWRFRLGGFHLDTGVEPDIAVYAKALGNGHPMGALVGRSDVMDASQSTFISSTYWTESLGPTAALATIHKMQQIDVAAHVHQVGQWYREGLQKISRRHQIAIKITGRNALLHLEFEHPEAQGLITLFTTRMLDHNFLAGSGFYPSLSHTQQHVSQFLEAADEIFSELGQAIQQGNLAQRLRGPVRQSGFARLT